MRERFRLLASTTEDFGMYELSQRHCGRYRPEKQTPRDSPDRCESIETLDGRPRKSFLLDFFLEVSRGHINGQG